LDILYISKCFYSQRFKRCGCIQSDDSSLSPRTNSTNSDLVRHNTQTYYVGETGYEGYTATGFV